MVLVRYENLLGWNIDPFSGRALGRWNRDEATNFWNFIADSNYNR